MHRLLGSCHVAIVILLLAASCSSVDDTETAVTAPASTSLATETTTPSTSTSMLPAPDTTTTIEANEPSEPNGPGGPGETGNLVTVVDGDTIRVIVDGVEERVRLIGIDTPESGECLADRATERLVELLGEGDAIELVRDESDRDQYDRLLRYIVVDGRFVNAALVAEGLALSRPYAPDTSRQDELDQAQTAAQEAAVGLWDRDACGAAVATDLEISEINENPPGNDTLVLNEEWVEIRNAGADTIDLSGWVVRDESASKRFPFPDGFALAPGAAVKIRSGCGIDSPTDLHWCQTGSAVWNNDGDTVFLLDSSGNIHLSVSY